MTTLLGRIYWVSHGGDPAPLAVFAWDPEAKTKTYLGSCALGGEWIRGSSAQGLCLDGSENLAIHVLYSRISKEQQTLWRVPRAFHYQDIAKRPYYLGFPMHRQGTCYAVYYLKNATAMK